MNLLREIYLSITRNIHKLINTICLIITCSIVAWFFSGFTTDPILKVIFALIGAFIDVIANYAFCRGKHDFLKRTGNGFKTCGYILRSFLYFSIFACYIYFFAVSSAVTFFASSVIAKEKAAQTVEYTADQSKNRITQIDKLITALNKQLDKESETGYGANSKAVVAQIESLSKERRDLLDGFHKSSEAAPEDHFSSLEEVYNMDSNKALTLILKIAVMMLYLGMVMTSWWDEIFDNVTPVTQAVTDKNDDVTECACGCGLPSAPGRKYYDDSHKQRAYRYRKELKEG